MKTSALPLLLLALLSLSLSSSAAGTTAGVNRLDYRSYPSGQLFWLWTPQNILLYRFDTKALKTMLLSESAQGDSVHDIAENSGELWIVTQRGLYQIDMNTSTVERIPGGPSNFQASKAASDIDYAWVAKHDTLWKFDKLSREWFSYGLGANSVKPGHIIGAYSDGDRVYLITRSRVLHFSIADEKWSVYPMGAVSFSPAAHFYPGTTTLMVVEGNKVCRYIMEKLSWDVVTTPSDILDLHYSDDLLFLLTDDGVFQYTASSSSLKRLDIPDTRSIRCLSLLSDTTLMLASERSLIQYAITSRTMEYIPYPPQMGGTFPDKIFQGDILLYAQTLTLFNWSTRTWELFRVPDAAGRTNVLAWDDRSLRLTYAPEFESQLHGNITQRVKLIDGGYLYDSVTLDSERVFYYTPGKLGDDLYADLTLHTSLSGDRYMDLTFEKEAGSLPEKGLFYRGEEDDYLESARLGTNTMTTTLSQTLPEVQYEGANAIVHSKQELATRDRKVVRAQGGAGLRTSRTMHSVLQYNKGGKYTLADPDSLKRYLIIPGSVRINVDGEEVDTLLFSVAPLTGVLTFNRRDLLDPSSVIMATYKVQTVPDSGLDVVELIPQNNFGVMSHGAATVSPLDWVSVQAGYASVSPRFSVRDSIGVDTLDSTTVFETRDSTGRARAIGNLMVPLEFRNTRRNFLLKITPELSYEAGKKAQAGAIGLQSRLGDWYLGKATSLFLNTSLFDTAYEATDVISRGYGRKEKEIDAKIQHDILTALPLTGSYANRLSRFGNEEYIEASAGVHFQDVPKLDLILSRNVIDADNSRELVGDTTADTLILDRKKDKIKLRFYEPSSPLAQSLLHLNKVSYDLSYTRFASHKESDLDPLDSRINNGPRMPGSGDIMYGSLSLSPISSITVSGLTTYKKNSQDTVDFTDTITMHSVENSPYLLFQTIDAPPGFDISGTYAAEYVSAARTDTGGTSYDSGQVAIQRQFLVIVKPGTWTRHLAWLSPRFGMSHDLTCTYDTVKRSGVDIFLGSKQKSESNLTYSFGSHFYPTGEILFRQENAITASDSIRNFYTFNDLKWWFGANRLWQTRLEFNDIVTTSLADGNNDGSPETELQFRKNFLKTFMFYDANWYSWLRTYERASIDFARRDSSFFEIDTVSGALVLRDTSANTLSFGPELMVSFNVQRKGPIKMLLNYHTAKLAWTRENGRMKQGASFSYTTFVELILKPNVAFQSNNAMSWSHGLFTYNGDLSMRLLF
ncbi:MAG: hypothetical protein JXA71_16185 [Chitinispirillaceae bacterium]|nr:hypothetical protein [Chitinispirillaceae bacterium]